MINVTCGWSFEPLCLGLKLGRTFIQTSLEENFVLLYLWLEVGNYLSIVFVLSVFQDIWHLEWSANCLTIWSVSWRETYTEIYKHITLSSSTDQLDLRALKVVHLRSREIKDWFDDFKVLLMFFFSFAGFLTCGQLAIYLYLYRHKILDDRHNFFLLTSSWT